MRLQDSVSVPASPLPASPAAADSGPAQQYWLGALRVCVTGAGSKPGILFGHVVEKTSSVFGPDREVRHRVAVKLAGGLRGVDGEARVLQQLAQCPAAVNSYGVHESPAAGSSSSSSSRYLVMELFGADLTSVMTGADNKFSRIEVWKHAVFALASIHSFEIVHGDVKPENILVLMQTDRSR